MRVVLMVSALCLAIPVISPHSTITVFVAFIIFEVCVGIFWPAMGFMRGIYVPEATRATIMNFFRVPLNMIVIAILYQNLPMHVIFEFCTAFLLLAAITQQWLFGLVDISLTKAQVYFSLTGHRSIEGGGIGAVGSMETKQPIVDAI